MSGRPVVCAAVATAVVVRAVAEFDVETLARAERALFVLAARQEARLDGEPGRAVAGEAPRRALAIMTAAFGVGQITGPLLAGIAADLTGSFFAPSIGAAVALMIAGLVGLQASNQRTA